MVSAIVQYLFSSLAKSMAIFSWWTALALILSLFMLPDVFLKIRERKENLQYTRRTEITNN